MKLLLVDVIVNVVDVDAVADVAAVAVVDFDVDVAAAADVALIAVVIAVVH